MPADFPNLHIIDHPLVRRNLTCMRDVATPADEFRRRLRELTLLMVYEVTRDFEEREVEVETPLAKCKGSRLAKPVVVVPILRAALGMAEALLEVLPQASVGHIGMYRDEITRRPKSYYEKHPANLGEARTLLVDPMLATGHSACAAIETLRNAGAVDLTFVCLVSCPEGLRQVTGAHPGVTLFTAAVDSHLNENAYIVPGLGDAGDRYFGTV